jgi:hypothetical protein
MVNNINNYDKIFFVFWNVFQQYPYPEKDLANMKFLISTIALMLASLSAFAACPPGPGMTPMQDGYCMYPPQPAAPVCPQGTFLHPNAGCILIVTLPQNLAPNPNFCPQMMNSNNQPMQSMGTVPNLPPMPPVQGMLLCKYPQMSPLPTCAFGGYQIAQNSPCIVPKQ